MFIIFTFKYRDRVNFIKIIFVLILSILAARLTVLQIYPSEEVLNNYVSNQRENICDLKYKIYDANGKDMLDYKEKYVLVIDKKPFSLNNYEENLQELLALNFIMEDEVEDFNYLDIMKSTGKQYFYISKDSYEKIKKIINIKGIYVYTYEEAEKREAWSVENILSDMPEESTIVENSIYDNINNWTKENIKPHLDFFLDSKSVYVETNEDDDTTNKNLKLTIDSDIQEKIKTILKDDKYSNLENIGVTIMESDTGKIRAMVQKDETEANINLGIEGSGFEPGSIFKLITLSAALEEGEVTMNDLFNCTGRICKSGAHGNLTLESALIISCNDCFAKVGEKLGYNNILKYAKDSGLFSKVLDISGEGTNETIGSEPDIEAGIDNISIGQCLTVSPIQMLGATNAIVNNGIYIKPYIIDSIVDDDVNEEEAITTESHRVYSETTSKLVKRSMIEVVNKGTGINAKLPGVTIGGKTGSATGGNGDTHGWFTGFFELKGKTYTMTVFVPNLKNDDENLGGGNTAAPIFKDIVKLLYS